jgi:hypothetical protein
LGWLTAGRRKIACSSNRLENIFATAPRRAWRPRFHRKRQGRSAFAEKSSGGTSDRREIA